MQLESTLTALHAAIRPWKPCQPMPACSSMIVRAAGCALSPSLATVAYFAPMARFRVRRSRPTTAVARQLCRSEGADLSPRLRRASIQSASHPSADSASRISAAEPLCAYCKQCARPAMRMTIGSQCKRRPRTNYGFDIAGFTSVFRFMSGT
jgi:hypothetical protein